MTFSEFVEKWNGKGIDFDGAYGNQCMDLMHQYILEVHGLPGSVLRAPTAYQAFLNGDEHYEKIDYKRGLVPQAGDIIFWTSSFIEGTGHVAICLWADERSFASFDQNFPLNTKCHEQAHSYRGIAGWLRLKQPNEKRMIKLLANRRLVWIKPAGATTAEYWVIRTNAEHPLETRHKVEKNVTDTVTLFGSYGKVGRVEWPEIAGLTEGKPFDLHDLSITHPELFEEAK